MVIARFDPPCADLRAGEPLDEQPGSQFLFGSRADDARVLGISVDGLLVNPGDRLETPYVLAESTLSLEGALLVGVSCG